MEIRGRATAGASADAAASSEQQRNAHATSAGIDAVALDALTADLDAEQHAAVTTGNNLVAVIAGAGSGKTRVLTRRIAYRIATGAASAQHTLALTFTREAAGELRRRLRHIGVTEAIPAGTFHSMLLAVLRQRWEERGAPARTVLPDRRRYVVELVGSEGKSAVDGLLAELDWAATRGIQPSEYTAAARQAGRRPALGFDRTAELAADYDQLKRRRGVIDFDDVLSLTAHEIRRDQVFAESLRWRFRHIYVDEAQDLNPVQQRLVELLAGPTPDLFLVGDPAQAIYGFNGADPALLLEIETRFPGIEVIRLPTNHRCTPQVVDAGLHVLHAAGMPFEAQSRRPDGPAVELLVADDATDEAERIARYLGQADPSLIRSGNVAVLARTNAQLAPIESALVQARLPIASSGVRRNSALGLVLGEVYALSSASQLRAWAHDAHDAAAETGGGGSSEHERRTGVADAVLEFLREHPRGNGSELRNWIFSADPFGSKIEGGIELLSFHAAKGREWHTVALAGVETSLVPHKSATTNEARAEEARLLYVACTRATDRLLIARAERRGGYGRKPSPFLDGIDLSAPPAVRPPNRLTTRPIDEHERRAARLRAWRDARARVAGIDPHTVLSNHDLEAVASAQPSTVDELIDCTTLGPLTAKRLAPGLLTALFDSGADGGVGDERSRRRARAADSDR